MKSTKVFYAAILCLLPTCIFRNLNAQLPPLSLRPSPAQNKELPPLSLRPSPAQNKELPADYHFRLGLWEPKKPFDKRKGFKKAQKYAVKKASAFLSKKMGKNYFTKRIAPVFLDNFYKTFVPQKSGDIKLKGWMSIVDGSINQLVKSEKEHLVKVTEKFLPDLPMVRSLVLDLVNSQKLHMKNGVAHYEMDLGNTLLKKRVAPEIKMGKFSFSGGAETRLMTKSATPVAAFQFKDTEKGEQYGVKFFGKAVSFKMKTKHMKANVDWKPKKGLKFNLHLTF